MSLYNTHRPDSFGDIVGNDVTVEVLSSILKKPVKPQAYLFYGDHGCSKTTIGRILAKELGAYGMDYQEIDSGMDKGIDSIRDLRKSSAYAPMDKRSTAKVYLLDEIHKCGTGGNSKKNDAQNALLKSLESPPKNVYYILCTTNPEMLLKTIRSRCMQFKMNTLNDTEMMEVLRRISRLEKTRVDRESYASIIKSSEGHPRDAIQLLEQVINTPEEHRKEIIANHNKVETEAIELCRALCNKASWSKVSGILIGLKKEDAESIRRLVMAYCISILLKGQNKYCASIIQVFHDNFYDNGFNGLVYACYYVTCIIGAK